MAFGIYGKGSDEHYLFVCNAVPFSLHSYAYKDECFDMNADAAKHFSTQSDCIPSVGIHVLVYLINHKSKE